ncbi:MAG: hypothetical protein N2689_11110, partial [Verrucomicrobiae bacterium]|nr:hypothetical protein [Verrucomicrobiae bacterium]
LLNDVGEIYRNLLFLDDLFTFLDLRPQLHDPETPAAAPAGKTGAGRSSPCDCGRRTRKTRP